MPSEIQKLKEEKAQLTQKYNSCYTQLNQCYNDCPIIEYNGITSQMKSTIHELITYSYTHYSNFETRATYIADRMSQIYNKNRWSCVIGKSSSYWGYYVRYVNDLYYTYTYKSVKWTIFTGFYN